MKNLDEQTLSDIKVMSHSAHGFLNAYEVLSPHNWMASQNLLPREDRKYIIPADFVCLAFSLEIGLKALLRFQKKSGARGHDLSELYDLLPENIRNDVYLTLCRLVPSYSNLDLFKDLLHVNKKAFEKWRYSFELKNDRLDINPDFLFNLSKSVLSVVSEYYKNYTDDSLPSNRDRKIY